MDSDTESYASTNTQGTNEPFVIEEEEVEATKRDIQERVTSSRMTKYEKAYVLGIRSSQLSMNAPPLVDIGNMTDALDIAEKELRERKIPFIIRRRLPDNTYEDWPIKEMVIPE